jgi:hypothetical protein
MKIKDHPNGIFRRRILLAKALRLGGVIFFILSVNACAGEIEKRQVVELRKIADQVPTYPGFEKTGERVSLKRGVVYLFNYYKSDAQFSEIQKFYDQTLTQNGWVLAEPEEYRRGDYVIAVHKLERTEKKFDVVFIWRPR